MTNPSPQSKESNEKLRQNPSLTVEQLNRASKEVLKKDPNAPYTTAMASVDVANPSIEDSEGLTFMQSEIISIIAMLGKKHKKLDLKKVTPGNLTELVKKGGIKLETSEIIALSKLEEVRLSTQSRLHRELMVTWPDWTKEAESARMGMGEKYLTRLKEKPGETLLLTAAGAAGIYIGLKAIGWLIGKGVGAVKGKVKEKVGSNKGWLIGGGIVGALGLTALGVINKNEIKNWFMEMLGIPNPEAKMKEYADRLQRATSQEEVDRIKREIENLKTKADKAKEKGQAVIDKARELRGQGAWELLGREVPAEERERCIKHQQFFKGLNTGFDLRPELFAMVGNENYEDFMDPANRAFGKVSSVWRLLIDKDKEAFEKIPTNFGVGSLTTFFGQMLKNKGDFPEFKEKTVYEVMDIIEQNPDKYVDYDKKFEITKKDHALFERVDEATKDPKKLKEKKWWQQTVGEMMIQGVTFVASSVAEGGVFVMKHGVHILTIEGETFYGAFQYVADKLKENDSGWVNAIGHYVAIGGTTAAIGAPLGTAAGFLRGMSHYPSLTMALKGSIAGTIKGLGKGFVFPLKAAWVTGKAGISGNPIRTLEVYMNEYRFIIDDLKLGTIGNKLGLRTYADKLLSGEIIIKSEKHANRTIRALFDHQQNLKAKSVELGQMAKSNFISKERIRNIQARVESQMKKIEDTLLKMTDYQRGKGCPTGIDSRLLRQSIEALGMESKYTRIVAENPRLSFLLMGNPENPISQLIITGKRHHLIELLDSNEDIFNALTKNKGLINDYKILEALKKANNAGGIDFFKTTVLERIKFWEKLKGREIRFLGRKPEYAEYFTRLKETLINTKGGDNFEFRILRKIILAEKSEHAKYLMSNLDEMKILFEGTEDSQKAIRYFLSIDKAVLKRSKEMRKVTELFINFRGNEEKIIALVTKIEKGTGVGKMGRMAIRLRKIKAGICDWINTRIPGLNRNTINAAIAHGHEGVSELTAEIAIAEQKMAAANSEAALQPLQNRLKLLKKAKSDTNTVVRNLENVKTAQAATDMTSQTGTASNVIHLDDWKAARAAMDTADEGATLTKELLAAEDALEESLEQAGKSTQAIGKTSKFAKFMKGFGIAGSAVGAGFSFWEAGKSGYEAFTTDIEGRAPLEVANMTLWAANGAADAAMFATLVGSKSTLATGMSRAWAPLIPITYAGTKIYETLKEETMTELEWGRSYNYNELIQQWFSTSRAVALGDAWVTGFGIDTIDESMENKKEIAHKMFRVLTASQTNPELMSLMYEQNPTKEKDKKIEDIIENTYTRYHEYYYQEEQGYAITNYQSARHFISEASLFNRIMLLREENKRKGISEFKIGPINLMESRYDISAQEVKANKYFKPSTIVEYYKNQMLEDQNRIPHLKENFDQMETSELLTLYVQINLKLAATQRGELELSIETLSMYDEYLTHIRTYLECKRDILMSTDIQNEVFFSAEMTPEYLEDKLSALTESEGIYDLIEKRNIAKTPAIYAMHKLAQYFGYTGNPTEEELKSFFSENKASYQGIYWDGEDWMVQESGLEFDEKIGPNLNKLTIMKMINELLLDPEDVIEHRHDSVFTSAYEKSGSQVKTMADILLKSYQEGEELIEKQKSEKTKESAHIA